MLADGERELLGLIEELILELGLTELDGDIEGETEAEGLTLALGLIEAEGEVPSTSTSLIGLSDIAWKPSIYGLLMFLLCG